MDYYAELELPPDATPDDIKRQYRKLALQYHPDRNPGKEAECSARFQAIGQAHEVLLDPEQRRKYDLTRQPRNAHNTFPRQTNTSRRRDPFPPASTTFDPPPKRNDPRYPQRPPEPPRYNTTGPPPSANGAPAGSGASRYARFPNPPPGPNTANTSSKQDARARANVFNAWQSMNHASKAQPQTNNYRPSNAPPQPPPRQRTGAPPPDLPPRDDIPTSGAFGRERPTSGERTNAAYSRGRPGFRVPPSYFDPTSPRDPPGSAGANTATESINATSGAPPNNPNFMAPPPPPFYKNSRHARPTSQEQHTPQASPADEVPFTEGSNRYSTPYTNHMHERTRLDTDSIRRSASTKDTPRWAQDATPRKPEDSGKRPQSMGRTPEGGLPRSRRSSTYNGVEVEVDDSMDGDHEASPRSQGARPTSSSNPQPQPQPQPQRRQSQPDTQSQPQQAQQRSSPPPEAMDVDPPPATGLDNMQDISADLPQADEKKTPVDQPNGNKDPLDNMSSMASDLPTGTSTNSFFENLSQRTSNADLPTPPKAPTPPTQLSSITWGTYLSSFSAYISAWNTYNGTMISQFQDSAVRCDNCMKGPAGGMVEGWLGAVGAADGLCDWQDYCQGVRDDERLRTAWNVACERHREAVEKHSKTRARVLAGQLSS